MSYIGNKGGQTILPFLANYIPPAKRYFSFCCGGGGLEFSKDFRHLNWIVSEKDITQHKKYTVPGTVVYNCYKELVENYNFTSEDFIFIDVPYLKETRRNGSTLYKYDWDVPEHVEFLNYINGVPANVMICHPKHEMYTMALDTFKLKEYRYMTRGGIWFNDAIYFNYDRSETGLLTYKYLGKDRTQRQQIKRQRSNIVKKIKNLPTLERRALLLQLQSMHHL